MDDERFLPSKETIRRFHERMGALYEQSATEKPRRRHKNAERDISNYHVNEAPPSEEEFKNTLEQKLTRAETKRPHMMAYRNQELGTRSQENSPAMMRLLLYSS